MTKNESHFEQFKPHTLLKHAVLEAYIVAWAMKLLGWGRAGNRLRIVDAFAGEGQDDSGNPGSPAIAALQAAEALRRFAKDGAEISIVAIEKSPARYRKLMEVMGAHRRASGLKLDVRQGELVDHIDELTARDGSIPTFFFLDPFGIKGLDASTYPKALAGPHNEIFALFADIGAVRLHGLITAPRADATKRIRETLAQPSLFPEQLDSDIAAIEEEVAKANDALDVSIPASREHLNRALGGDAWEQVLAQGGDSDRADRFLRLFATTLERAGAKYVLIVPMRNDAGVRVYSLVHASKSAKGFTAMKVAVSQGLNAEVLTAKAALGMRQDLSVDVAQLAARIKRAFAGLEIQWTGDQGLKQTILEQTEIFHFQVPDLKKALVADGILVRKDRKDVCVFPGQA